MRAFLVLSVLFFASVVLANNCFDPIDLPAAGALVTGSSLEADFDDGALVPSCGTFPSGKSIWYRITPNRGDEMLAFTCNSSPLLDTKVMVFEGDCRRLFCRSGNDDTCGLGSVAEWTASGRVSYLIRLSFESDEAVITRAPDGEFELQVTANEPTIVIETESVEMYIPFRITFLPVGGGYYEYEPTWYEWGPPVWYEWEPPFWYEWGPRPGDDDVAVRNAPVHDKASFEAKLARKAEMRDVAELYIICNGSGETLLDFFEVTTPRTALQVVVWGVQPNQQCFFSLEYFDNIQLSREFFLTTGNGNFANPYDDYEYEYEWYPSSWYRR